MEWNMISEKMDMISFRIDWASFMRCLKSFLITDLVLIYASAHLLPQILDGLQLEIYGTKYVQVQINEYDWLLNSFGFLQKIS